jgi:hypothetical protein
MHELSLEVSRIPGYARQPVMAVTDTEGIENPAVGCPFVKGIHLPSSIRESFAVLDKCMEANMGIEVEFFCVVLEILCQMSV